MQPDPVPQQPVKREPQAQQQAQQQQPPQLQPYHLATVAPGGERVSVALNNASTWRKFNRQNTEMIVTKAGRRMFPALSLDIRGLEPTKKYELYVTLLLADQHTLKYQRGQWIPNGPSETYPPPGCASGLVYMHPDSPATGRQWSKQEVTFMKLKLTNKLDGFDDPSRSGSMIFAYSMHKYLPVVHISEVAPPQQQQQQPPSLDLGRYYTSVVFPGTEFITVTAYQNPELTDLKIQFNPYAKGIRNQTDRSSAVLIESFRPTVQAIQQRQQPQQQQQQEIPQPQQDRREAEEAQQQPQLPAGFEFGYYGNQTSSAFGHWQSQLHQQPHQNSIRRNQPYSLPGSRRAAGGADAVAPVAQESSYFTTDRGQYFQPLQHEHQQQQQEHYEHQYQQHHQYHHQLWYPSYYSGYSTDSGTGFCGGPGAGLTLELQPLASGAEVASDSAGAGPLSPPPPPGLQVPQTGASAVHQHHHQQQQQATVHAATPRGCSTLASSSHFTDSSPSGVSFNSPDL